MTRAVADPNQMSFFEHLEELRGRILKSLILWVVVFIICFFYAKPLFDLLAAPFLQVVNSQNPFAATVLQEPFFARIKAAFWVSVILSSGIFFYHIWSFVSPGMTRSEKRFAIPFLIFMALLFLVGCAFSFSQAFPFALDFLVSWNEGSLNAYTRSSYLSLLFTFVIGMGLSFELPLVIFFLAKIGLVTPQFLMANFKYAIVIIFTIAAIITPTPDWYLQSILAGPMIVLYLVGVGAAYLVKRDDDRFEQELEAGTAGKEILVPDDEDETKTDR